MLYLNSVLDCLRAAFPQLDFELSYTQDASGLHRLYVHNLLSVGLSLREYLTLCQAIEAKMPAELREIGVLGTAGDLRVRQRISSLGSAWTYVHVSFRRGSNHFAFGAPRFPEQGVAKIAYCPSSSHGDSLPCERKEHCGLRQRPVPRSVAEVERGSSVAIVDTPHSHQVDLDIKDFVMEFLNQFPSSAGPSTDRKSVV